MILREQNRKNQLIGIDEILELLKSNNDILTITFESGEVDDEYRKLLQNKLSKYHVFNVRWTPELWIYPSIETSRILEKKDDIFNAADSFRKDGIRLMKMLGETYQINPFEGGGLFELKRESAKNKQRGKVNDEWNYWFHGEECQFENKVTGQIVELVITNKSEFGALDSFFFLKYLQTTPRFQDLAEFFSDDSKAVTKALNILEDMGMLKRISNTSQRGIIALCN